MHSPELRAGICPSGF